MVGTIVGLPRWSTGKESARQFRRCRRDGQSLGQEDSLEEEMATHSSILAWRIPWTEEPDGLQSMGLRTVRHNITTEHTHRHNSKGQGTHTHTHTQKSLSHVRLFATPWIVAHQAPWSMGFSRHEYWSGLPFPSPRDGSGARKVQRRYLSIFGVGEVEVSAMIYKRNRLLT